MNINDYKDGNGNVLVSETLVSDLIDEKANKQQQNWIAPTLLNGWVNEGSVFETAGYYKDEFGVVHLKGLIKGGTVIADTILLNLPSGYRPHLNIFFAVMSNNTIGIALVGPDGDTRIRAGSNVSFCLDGISFRTT